MSEINKMAYKVEKGRNGIGCESEWPSNTPGKTWEIKTYKGSGGNIISYANEGVKEVKDGWTSFSFDLFGGNKKDLGKVKAVGTQKNIEAAHIQALTKFHEEIEAEALKEQGKKEFAEEQAVIEEQRAGQPFDSDDLADDLQGEADYSFGVYR